MDTGLLSLVTVARFHQSAIEADQLAHEYARPGGLFTDTEILQAAKAVGFKARLIQTQSKSQSDAKTLDISKLANIALPAIAKHSDGSYFVIAKISQTDIAPDSTAEKEQQASVLIQRFNQNSNRPEVVDDVQLSLLWTGELILLTQRGNLKQQSQSKFDISWFIPSLIKYRKLFAEVFIAAFFLQIFALVTPLFFQVVMDKVLVHRGFTTLDVLAVGFFVIIAFEAILGGIRNYVFSHTANRVDVELGSRLFKHLMSLPLAYFESRQVGQTVARVRELDSLRNFITGTALTLVIDLLFVFIFFAVMYYYSPALTWIVVASIPAYVVLSIFITPILRHRLDEKFKHGAANTAFLTESVTGVGTVKSMALEPHMSRKLEDHLSAYVHAGFRSQIKMADNQISVNGKAVNLTPGMSVTAEIQTGHRRIIEFITAPLQQAASESLRER